MDCESVKRFSHTNSMRGRIKQHKSTILVINFLIDTPCVNLVPIASYLSRVLEWGLSQRERARGGWERVLYFFFPLSYH